MHYFFSKEYNLFLHEWILSLYCINCSCSFRTTGILWLWLLSESVLNTCCCYAKLICYIIDFQKTFELFDCCFHCKDDYRELSEFTNIELRLSSNWTLCLLYLFLFLSLYLYISLSIETFFLLKRKWFSTFSRKGFLFIISLPLTVISDHRTNNLWVQL